MDAKFQQYFGLSPDKLTSRQVARPEGEGKDTLPATVTCGYPPKTYTFTGEWQEETLGKSKVLRNSTPVWYPIYKAEDGSLVCFVEFGRLIRPEPPAPEVQ
jgi:hypothetical protein